MRKTILLFAFFLAPLCAFAQQGNQSLPGAGSGGGISFAIGGGSAQAQTVNPSTAITVLTNGLQICWLPIAANTAAAPTVAVSGLTAKPITKYGTVALVANDITTAAIACVIYDGTQFQLQNPQTVNSSLPNAAAQFSIPYYSAPGSASTLSALCSPPATNGTYSFLYSVTASAAVQPTCPQVGLTARAITGAATTDTVLYSDVAGQIIVHDKAASGAVTVTLPTPTTLGNPNAVFVYTNHSAQTDTITPTTWTIQSNGTAAGATLSIPSAYTVRISPDPFNATNWIADTINMSAGLPCTSTALSLQYNNAGAFGCLADFTFSTAHTILAGASGIVNLAAAGNGGLVPPSGNCGVNTGTRYIAIATSDANEVCYDNGDGNQRTLAVAGVAAQATTCTNQVVTVVSSVSAPTCTSLSEFVTSDYTNATTTLSNVTGLAIPLAANTNYAVSCKLIYQGSASTASLVLSSTGPASPTKITGQVLQDTTAGAGATLFSQATDGTTFGFTLGAAAIVTTATDLYSTLDLGIENGANAGTFQLQAKANGAGTVTIKTGSFCKQQ